MKKIITTILLLLFCVEPTCWATEIIVGADGQARYADEAVTPVIKRDIKGGELKEEATKKENITQEHTIETKVDLEKAVKPYEKKNKKIIKNAEKNIDYQKIYKKVSNLQDIKDRNSVITFQLQDGDYALWELSKNNEQYAAEYHKDNSCMGIVKIKKLDRNTFVFYEYRSETIDAKTAPLKHIMIAYNDKHKANFIYNHKNELRCYQYDGKTYSIDMPNLPVIQEENLRYRNADGENIRSKIAYIGDEIGARLLLLGFILVVLPILSIVMSNSSTQITH